MKNIFSFLFLLSLMTSCSTTYYIVRHAEKEVPSTSPTMSTSGDVQLSAEGKARAVELLETLKDKNIRHAFSTNTIRTTSTARPLCDLRGIEIQFYNHRDTLPQFVDRLYKIKKGNVLIVGHSNTVDDVVNKLYGSVKIPADLLETQYDNLYVVKKKGTKFSFENKKYGTPTN
jgi:broad specificity phosphatase PhoE